jgi:PTS system fructose-specific IIC component/PTS system nitrogen regulatory IIA component
MLGVIPVRKQPRKLLLGALESREQAGPTVIDDGIAMPHCRSILVDDFVIVVGRSARGIRWPDDMVRLVILFVSPVKPTGPQEHMELIRHLVQAIKAAGPAKLSGAASPAEIMDCLDLELIESGEDEPGS